MGKMKGGTKMTTIEKIKNEHYWFITEDTLPNLIKENRLQPCLVRCSGGRFTCPAQDVAHFVAIIDASTYDYVRDVSIPAGY